MESNTIDFTLIAERRIEHTWFTKNLYFTEIENAGIDFSAESIDDMTHALLKMRDDLIKTKVAKETLEERSTSEVSFLKTQLQAEQQAKEAVEDQLSGKISFAKK